MCLATLLLHGVGFFLSCTDGGIVIRSRTATTIDIDDDVDPVDNRAADDDDHDDVEAIQLAMALSAVATQEPERAAI